MEIARNMELTIVPEGKEFRSNRLLRIFGKPNSILKNLVKHKNN